MSHRRVGLTLLCEDSQHEAFVRRFLKATGWSGPIYVKKSPQGRGAGEQWVRAQYPRELQALRHLHHSAVLLVMVDADRATVSERVQDLDAACVAAGLTVRTKSDRVAIAVPRRNIETWLSYLNGEDVNEDDAYPKLSRQRDCLSQVAALKAMCLAGRLRIPAPPSLEAACAEYRSRMLV